MTQHRACKHQHWRFQSPILLGSRIDGYQSCWEHLQEQLWSCRVEAPLPDVARLAAASGCTLTASPQTPGTLSSDIGLQNLSCWHSSFVACAWLPDLPCLLKCRLLCRMDQLGCWVLHCKAGNKTSSLPITYLAKPCFPLCFLNYPQLQSYACWTTQMLYFKRTWHFCNRAVRQ